jgi:hypothetical protein
MQQKEDKASREEEAKMKISCRKDKIQINICIRKKRKASREEETKVENPAATKTKPTINDIHENEAKMTENQIINEKTWQEKKKKKKIATSKNILTKTPKKQTHCTKALL